MSTQFEASAWAVEPSQSMPIEFSGITNLITKSKQAIGRAAIILGLTTGLVTTEATAFDSSIAIADNDYPDSNKPCIAMGDPQYGQAQGNGYWCNGYQWGDRSTGQQNSSRGYGYRNCTDWAAFRATQLTGIKVPWGLGNANTWDEKAASKGFMVDHTPEVGDIAVWNTASFGHVEVVEAVNPDGSVNTSGYNKRRDGNYGMQFNVRADAYIDLNGISKGSIGNVTQSPPPNTDGDSLYDFEDACPTVHGTPLLHGCPAEHKTEGDFNGDGYGDILVSSIYPDGKGMALHLYKGSPNGLTGPEFQQELTPVNGGWAFQHSKMVATNVNGDTYNDLVIFHQGPMDEVARHVFKGSATGLQLSDPSMTAVQFPHEGWKWTNLRVAGAGDFNGDGYGDVAMFSLNPNRVDSALHVYKGSPSGLVPEFQRELTASNGGWNFWQMKSISTNVDGDAYSDLVIFHQGPVDEVGRHVLKGSAAGIQDSDPAMVDIQYPHQGWKWSSLRIAGAGDFNGDGYGDVAMISANPNARDFVLHNYLGSTTGLTSQFQMELTATNGGWDLIKTRGATADVTGDGKTDIVLFHQGPVDEVGRHILKGSPAGTQPSDPAMTGVQYPYQGWLWSRVLPA